MPEDIACESELPPEADNDHGQSDDGGDAPGSQSVPARSLRLRKALRWDGVVHASASCHAPDRREAQDPPWACLRILTVWLAEDDSDERDRDEDDKWREASVRVATDMSSAANGTAVSVSANRRPGTVTPRALGCIVVRDKDPAEEDVPSVIPAQKSE